MEGEGERWMEDWCIWGLGALDLHLELDWDRVIYVDRGTGVRLHCRLTLASQVVYYVHLTSSSQILLEF